MIESAGDDFLLSWSGYRIMRISCRAEVVFVSIISSLALRRTPPVVMTLFGANEIETKLAVFGKENKR